MTIQSPELLKNVTLRNIEYYGLQENLDQLYERSKKGDTFKHLMKLIKSEDNIMLAYRNIKSNKGSLTPSVDKITLRDIEQRSKTVFIRNIQEKLNNYHPKIVRRKEIPKPNGKTRPLGIPSIWDRIIQQCILQVLEPICEAKFIKDSFCFRPNCSAEHAIARAEMHINVTKLHYVVDIDIKGFFDEVNHVKLMRQLWTLGIQDKQLLVIIRKILKAPIKMPNGNTVFPLKGTPQGGILSPLLANINLNEFDHWIEQQWAKRDVSHIKPSIVNNRRQYSPEHRYLKKKTKLKQMYIVRYADDFKIFTNNRSNAEKIFKAVSMWLEERLKLPISLEKSKVTNLKKDDSEFLGFKLKARKKGKKRVCETHISDKSLKRLKENLFNQIKVIQKSGYSLKTIKEINKYNSMVIGLHNYYSIANQVNIDLQQITRELNIVMYHKFQKARIRGRPNSNGFTPFGKYNGKDKGILKYIAHGFKSMRYYMKCPILPIGNIKRRTPLQKRLAINKYTVEGRKIIHKQLGNVTPRELQKLRNRTLGTGRRATVQLYDNRIALYVAQRGKCPISGKDLLDSMHLHHKIPWSKTHDDSYDNLILLSEDVHRLIHATNPLTIQKYLDKLEKDTEHLDRLNELRELLGNHRITL